MSDSKTTLTVIKLVIVLFIVMLLVSGGTYALWEIAFTDTTNVVFTTSVDYSCSADGGGPITSSEVVVMPTDCTSEKNVINREVQVYTQFKNDSISSVATSLWLNINDLGSELSNSEHFRYALTTSRNSCSEDVVVSGNFNGKSAGDKVDLLNNKKFSTGTPNGTYYLYIWLDKEETNPDTANQSFNFSLGGECSDSSMIPENPVLEEGMIPVTIADDGKVTTVSASDPDWYDYSKQEWANMVLVSDTNRSNYVNNLSKNVEVSEDDILAYYVWVPRYKYKVWTLSTGSSPQTIDIVFESKDSPMVSGTTIGSYRTHPAFWWDNNMDGEVTEDELLAGIWVGKFETTPDKSSDCYSTPSSANCNNTTQNPTILPNESSLRYQYIGNQFTTSQNISKNGNVYGISNTKTDAHMMKNSEWGAAAYLSHSQYGINKEVRINNYWNETDNKYTLTGCGAATATTISAVTTCSIAYGSGVSSYPQSTSGNISGVFDMSGGTWEYVMGNYGNTTNATYMPTLPDTKYYDLYSSTQFTGNYESNTELCTLETCGGHALNETAGWYKDYAYFVHSDGPWFLRGGYALDGTYAGAFRFGRSYGPGSNNYSWRSVLISMEPFVDSTSPTCTLSVTEDGIEFETYSDDVVSMGLSTSSTAEYNDTTSLALSDGTKYGYVKDAAGNTGSCSVDVSSVIQSTTTKTYSCSETNYNNKELACSSGYSYVSNSCSYEEYDSTDVYECNYVSYDNETSTDMILEWENTDSGYIPVSECIYYDYSELPTCDEAYLQDPMSETPSNVCWGSPERIYSGSITCRQNPYCPNGYTKLNDSYCYILN